MADDRPRCVATVQRADYGCHPEEPTYSPEPCGRLAKDSVRVGSRDVPVCGVHVKALRRGLVPHG